MTIKYWKNFNKRVNSTAQPSNSSATQLDNVNLKEPTSIENPTFILSNNEFEINYIQAMGHYYFVTDVVSIGNGRIEVSCTQDVLATYKSYITSSSQLVARCVTNPDYTLIDEAAIINTVPTVEQTIFSTSTPFSASTYTVILTVKGEEGSVFYGMGWDTFKTISTYFYSMTQTNIWNELGALPVDMWKSYLDPFGYIVEAKMIPLPLTSLSGDSTYTLKLGYWEYNDPDGANVFKKLARVCYTMSPVQIQINSLRTGDEVFLNSSRYRHVNLSLPGADNITLNADALQSGNTVDISLAVDVTGAVAYKIEYGGDYYEFSNGIIGTPIAMHSSIANWGQMIGTAMNVGSSVVGGAMAGASLGPWGIVGGALVGAGKGAATAISSGNTVSTKLTKGSDGSLAGITVNDKFVVTEIRYNISGRAPDRMGYPCMKYLQLSTLTGYCQCINASVSMPGFEEDKTAVEAHLNNGFYIE